MFRLIVAAVLVVCVSSVPEGQFRNVSWLQDITVAALPDDCVS
jgi:hypothetical protein